MTGIEYLKNGYSCAVFRGDRLVFSSNERGIAPLLQIIHTNTDVSDCEAFDKIVGRAAALLYVYMGVSCVYADVMSKGASEVFKSNGVSFEYKTLTEKIINRRNDGICPMESAVSDITKPREALAAIERRLTELKENVKEN